MKKIYALAAAAFMALAANAQNGAPLYITGQAGADDNSGFVNGNWNATTPDEFTFADGVYSIHVNNLSSFTISKACGSWDALQAEGMPLTCNYGDVPGVAVNLEEGKANILTPWLGDYDVVVAGDLSTITLTTNTPQPPMEVYLRGDMNGWGSPAEWLMTPSEGNKVFHFVCSGDLAIKAGESFKIADAGWAKYNYGATSAEAIELDLEYDSWFNSSDNFSLAEEWDGACWAIFTKDAEGNDFNQVFFSNDKEVEMPEYWSEVLAGSGVQTVAVDNNNATAKYYNLQGVEVANPESGLYIVVKGNETKKVLVK
ncbi:MAG: hypothetical protein HDS12_05705 [Bacteroides sp.]|nr:hypothetical protein [Bacteroidales bacterium]MBD5204856.1 hypothetical protein [Bacteroidales bacterium]MBD5223092.1 hypothetical protein [Bacteroidales bacterium]MBD5305764.1 hypothetical protein [Bacteroides sp.]MBD5348166.1 hypothetical protein [Bacteroides sp.]